MSELLFLDPLAFTPRQPDEPAPDPDGGYDEHPPDPDFPFNSGAGEPPKPEPKSGWPECEGCGLPITTYGGKGRRPKLCNDCKAKAGIKVTSRKPSGEKLVAASSDETYVAEGLMEYVGFVAAMVAGFFPVAGATMFMRAERTCIALTEVAARNHPRVYAGLRKFVESQAYVVLGESAAAIVYAGAVDIGRADPDTFIGKALMVSNAAESVGWQPPKPRTVVPANTGGGFLNTPPPPNFNLPPES